MTTARKTIRWYLAAIAIVALAGAWLLLQHMNRANSLRAKDELEKAAQEVTKSLPQPFSRLLLSMQNHESQKGTDGEMHELAAAVGIAAPEGAYIYQLCREVKPNRTLEVGFAEGFSAMYFLTALKQDGIGTHTAIDPFENTQWHGIGLEKVQEAGMTDRFRFVEAKSIAALPALTAEALTFDIIFIDGDHRFDGTFTDFVLSDPMCPKGGYILLHDIWMESTKKVLAFLERNRPDYARRAVPKGANIAAFQKIGDDKREWLHFVNF